MSHEEVVHVMLKPETVYSPIRDLVLGELRQSGGTIFWSRRLVLDVAQISAIYPDFPNQRAKPYIFKYFTSRETEHFAFGGTAGLHRRMNEAKGWTGTGKGIRGKYYKNFTRLSESALNEWLCGTSPEEAEIDLEMFAKDILHVADSPADSLRGLHAVSDGSIQSICGLRGNS